MTGEKKSYRLTIDQILGEQLEKEANLRYLSLTDLVKFILSEYLRKIGEKES